MRYITKLGLIVCFSILLVSSSNLNGIEIQEFELGSDTAWELLLGHNQDHSNIVMHADDDYAVVTTEENTMHLYSILPSGVINWTKTYVMDYGVSDAVLISLGRGGFAIACELFDGTTSKLEIIKTRENGDSIWIKQIEDEWKNASLQCRDLIESPNGDFVIVGARLVDDGVYNFFFSPFIISLSSDGENFTKKNWTYDSHISQSGVNSIAKCNDGSYIIVGYKDRILVDEDANPIDNDSDIYIARINSSGEIYWELNYGVGKHERAWDICQTSDGNYAIVGNFFLSPEMEIKPGFMKIDSNGNILSTHIYGGADSDGLFCIIQTQSGGLALGGCTASNFTGPLPDPWFVRTGSNGKFLWSRIILPDAEDADIGSIVECKSGGFICAILYYDEMYEYYTYIVRIPDSPTEDAWVPPYISHSFYESTTESSIPIHSTTPATNSNRTSPTSGSNFELLDPSAFIVPASIGVILLIVLIISRRKNQ